MRTYIIRRLLLLVPTLFIVSGMVFLLMRLVPGDIIDTMASEMGIEAGGSLDRAAIERRLGLDVPIHVQYVRWMGQILQGNLGTSLRGDEPVVEQILPRLPVTLELGVMAIVIGLLIALPVGIYSAIRQDTAADYLGRSVAIIGLATPNFWAGNYGHDIPGNLVGLVATDGVHSLHRRPAGESRHVPHPQLDSGDGRRCQHNAHDAHHDAGGPAARLYQDRLGQGSQ